MGEDHPTTSCGAGHMPGCTCECCCSARQPGIKTPCTCPPQDEKALVASLSRRRKELLQRKKDMRKIKRKGKEKLTVKERLKKYYQENYEFRRAPKPMYVGPKIGGTGYQWACELFGHIPNCPCERCQSLRGDIYNHTIKIDGYIYKFDNTYAGKVAHIPCCPCPDCRQRRGLPRSADYKLPKFRYKVVKEKKKRIGLLRCGKIKSEPPLAPFVDYVTHPLNCTCEDCCLAIGNEKPKGHRVDCKCIKCRTAAGLIKPAGHSDVCTCELCCAAAGNLKPANHARDCKCPECLDAIEPPGNEAYPISDRRLRRPPHNYLRGKKLLMYSLPVILLVVAIVFYVYWVGSLHKS